MNKRKWIYIGIGTLILLALLYFYSPVPQLLRDYAYQKVRDSQIETMAAERDALAAEKQENWESMRVEYEDSIARNNADLENQARYYRNLYERSKHQDINDVYNRTLRNFDDIVIPE